MNITFINTKLQKCCNSATEIKKHFGHEAAKALMRRLDDLRAAASLEEMRSLTGNCHQLKGDRQGQIAISLRGQNRLVFIPNHNPLPVCADGSLDWSKVTSIQIIEVNINYHGK